MTGTIIVILILALIACFFIINDSSKKKQYYSILDTTKKWEKELDTLYDILRGFISKRDELISSGDTSEIKYAEKDIRKHQEKIEKLSKIIVGNKLFLRNSKYNK